MRGAAIIIWDADEAEIVCHDALAKFTHIITLSPGALAAVKGKNLNVTDSASVYTDCAHARSVVNQLKARREFLENAQALGTLSEIQITAAANTLFYMSGAASFYYQLLKPYQTVYIINGKKLQKIEGFENAFNSVFSRILRKRYSGRDHEFSALHRWLMKRYNAHLINKIRGKRRIINIDGARPSSKNFAKAAFALEPEIVILSGRNPVKSIYVALRHMRNSLRMLDRKDYFSKRIPMYFFYPAKTRSFLPEAQKIAESAKSDFTKKLFTSIVPNLAAIFELAAGHEQSAREQILALKPDVITADGLASGYTMSVAKYARETGVPVLLFNHASRSPQTKAISKAIGNLWASLGITHSPFASHIAARSPAVARISREIDPNGNIIAVRHDKKIPLKKHEKFKILFAGNYLNVQEHVPWMLETPDEFIKGIAELVEAVAQIPEAELTIRVKPGKKDFNAEIMAKFIPAHPNVIVSNQGAMKEVLAETDLMVASISSTVEEALQSGRPLLLHSWPKRYQHLSVAENGRSAVYASKKGEPLVELLRKIIAAHKDNPLEDAELAPYIWPENEADMTGLAKRILEL